MFAEGPFNITAYGKIGKNVDRTDTSYTICTASENSLKNMTKIEEIAYYFSSSGKILKNS